ncbi:hypothetical protein MAIT1_05325 [Magnetofaba australis IT-1]|uniref:Uncharacterized protein n=1 Tax=Magnetofaba australis IT-1 TaxID=1434232 RepID=A0A1Y2K1M1_9PROT|nr:hypothetical protein MAIT1_05325 [Magnetofaba australis IT-1]
MAIHHGDRVLACGRGRRIEPIKQQQRSQEQKRRHAQAQKDASHQASTNSMMCALPSCMRKSKTHEGPGKSFPWRVEGRALVGAGQSPAGSRAKPWRGLGLSPNIFPLPRQF